VLVRGAPRTLAAAAESFDEAAAEAAGLARWRVRRGG
jgi:hypothetical protein